MLRKFRLRLRKLEAQTINNILNVEISEPHDAIPDSLNINNEVPCEVQFSLRELFVHEYVDPIRPSNPKVGLELKLSLTDEKPFYFNPRRVSVFEKEKLKKILNDLLERKII